MPEFSWAVDHEAIAARSEQTIPRMFFDVSERFGDSVALEAETCEWTYGELRTDVIRAINALQELGVKPGDHIGIWLPNGHDWIVSNLAILSLGAIAAPINTRLRVDEVQSILTKSKIVVLITQDVFLTNHYLDVLERIIAPTERTSREIHARRVPSLRIVVSTQGHRPWTVDYGEVCGRQSDHLVPEVLAGINAASPEETANIFWTSGSTGEPKGSMTNHRILGNIEAFCQILRLTPSDRCLVASPLFYVAGYYWCMLAPLQAGARMIALTTFSPTEILDAIEQHSATVLTGIATSHLRLLNDESFEARNLRSMRAMYSGGGALPEGAPPRFQRMMSLDIFVTIYGLTETGGIVTMTDPDASIEKAHLSIGAPLPGFEVRCVDLGTLRDVPVGERGEAWIATDYIHNGYFGISQDQPALVDGKWFRTGDLLSYDSTGLLHFEGRIKDIVKVGGENVAPKEVESVLRSLDGVLDVAVIGIDDEVRGEVVAAAVVRADETLTTESLRAQCREKLAPFKVPRVIRLVDTIPLTATGKPDVEAVREALMTP